MNLDLDTLLIFSIPLSSALVGWGTNVLALKMTFYPLDYVGIRPFGWQGIIPAKAVSMATRTVDLMTQKLVAVHEVIERLDPDEVVEALGPGVAALIEEIIDDVMAREQPELWATLPEGVKEQVYARAQQEAPFVIRESMADLLVEVEDVLDIKTMAIDALLADREFLNRIFLECGREEFRFIEKSGLYFGFLFGLAMMVAWLLFPFDALLPLFGFVIGWLTNYLALRMIFEPARPRQVLGFTWQGSFLKRQEEVSEAYARLVAQNIVSTENILYAIFDGPGSKRLLEIIERYVTEVSKDYEAVPRPVTNFLIGSEQYDALKTDIAQRIVNAVPGGPVYDIEEYAEEALDIENTLRARLEALPPEQFTGLLRPIFQEDEWKLILVGAVLGCLVGVAQSLVL